MSLLISVRVRRAHMRLDCHDLPRFAVRDGKQDIAAKRLARALLGAAAMPGLHAQACNPY
jgi:hypothetical protein